MSATPAHNLTTLNYVLTCGCHALFLYGPLTSVFSSAAHRASVCSSPPSRRRHIDAACFVASRSNPVRSKHFPVLWSPAGLKLQGVSFGPPARARSLRRAEASAKVGSSPWRQDARKTFLPLLSCRELQHAPPKAPRA